MYFQREFIGVKVATYYHFNLLAMSKEKDRLYSREELKEFEDLILAKLLAQKEEP